MTAPTYEIEVEPVSLITLNWLLQAGQSLYAMKAVRTNMGETFPQAAGTPLVWWGLGQVLGTGPSTISWQAEYQAYAGQSSVPVVLGQVVQVEVGGSLSVAGGGWPDAVTIINQTGETYTCGLSGAIGDGSFSPVVSVALDGGYEVEIAPTEQVLLMLAGTAPSDVVVGQAVLVEPGPSSPAQVRFDMNFGWGGGSNLPDGTSLAATLIQTLPLTQQEMAERMADNEPGF